MSTVKANTFQDASGGNTATINSMTPTADSLQGFRNRIINGDMGIDQRNAGASVSTSSGTLVYTLDRWAANYSQTSKYTVQQNAGSVTPPTGFTNYLGVTSTSAYSVLSGDYFMVNQRIEGFNVADLGWGTANAAAVTLSFWVRSSLTGTFGGVITNSAQNRSYPFTYTISAANTWELKTITIAGDTTGTWLTNNGQGLFVNFGLGVGSTYSGTAGAWSGSNLYSATGATSVVGTNGATFYITGVQLEVGSVATPFERIDYGTELALCQRYYFKLTPKNTGYFSSGYNNSTTVHRGIVNFPVSMRTEPTALEQTGTAADYGVQHGGSTVTNLSAVPSSFVASLTSSRISVSVASGLTQGQGSMMIANNDSAYLGWSAEL